MSIEEKAKIILEKLDKYIQIDYNIENIYLKGITEGLAQIQRIENNE